MKSLRKKILKLFLCFSASFILVAFCCVCIFSNKNNHIAYAVESNMETSEFLEGLNVESSEDSYSLRNEFKIDAEYQQDTLFCWLFSSLKCVETSYMKQKHEYYNFSEKAMAYFSYLYNIKYGKSKTYNTMGNIDEFVKIAEEYGLVFENDISNEFNEEIDYINENNYMNYDYILNYSNKNLSDNLNIISFDTNTYFLGLSYYEQLNIMQNFIKNYGALYFSIDDGGILYQPATGDGQYSVKIGDHDQYSSTPISDHAVCLIGWNEIGFIALNSNGWGTENYETFCIPYNPLESKLDYVLSDGKENLKGFVLKGKYEVQLQDSQSKQLKNVFSPNENLNLTYLIDEKYNINDMTVKINRGTEEVSHNFDVMFKDSSSQIIIKKGEILESGGYVVSFYSKNVNIAKLSFFVLSGSEVSGVILENFISDDNYVVENISFNNNYLTASNTTTYLINNHDKYRLKIVLSSFSKDNNLRDEFLDGTGKDLLFELSTIKMQKIENGEVNWIDTGLNLNKEIIDYDLNKFIFTIPKLNSNYQNKLLSFDIVINSTIDGGEETKLTFLLFVSEFDGAETNQNKKIIYHLEGGKNSSLNISNFPNYKTYNSMTEFILQNPIKSGFNFVGWFSDSEYKNQIFSISKQNLKDVVLYAKWDSLYDENYVTSILKIENVYNYNGDKKDSIDFIEYGDSINCSYTFRTKTEINSYNYSARIKAFYIIDNKTFYIDSINNSNVYTSSNFSFDLGFPDLLAGKCDIRFVVDVLINGVSTISVEKSLLVEVAKKQVHIAYEQLSFVYDGSLKLPKPIVEDGEVFEGDELEVIYSIFSQRSVGKYDFSVKSNNPNYEIAEDNKNSQFEIRKKELNINFETNNFVYNAKQQIPTIKLSGIVSGDYVKVDYYAIDSVNVGQYTAKINANSITNNNYIVKEETIDFKIVPADITIIFDDIDEVLIIAPQYRNEATFDVVGDIFVGLIEDEKNNLINSLNIIVNCEGLTTYQFGDYKINCSYNNSNFNVTIIEGVYHLSGNYSVFYELPDGTLYEEKIVEGENPKGVNRDIYKHTIFQKLEYSQPLEGDGTTNIVIKVTVKDNTLYFVVGFIIVSFLVIYLIMTRKQRRNKVS